MQSFLKGIKGLRKSFTQPEITALPTRPIVALDELETTLKFPLKIVGTRKPAKKAFWAWDINISPFLVRENLNPYFYLTFQDSDGQVVGPIRYHSELVGYGVKFELACRSQFGRLSGIKETEFNTLPRKFEVTGHDTSISTGGLASLHYTKLKFKDTTPGLAPELVLQYFGVSSPGGLGHSRIPNGVFEAEDTTCDQGLVGRNEKIGTFLVACSFIVLLGICIGAPTILIYGELM